MHVSRIIPARGPEAFKTYSVVMPLATHFRPATCGEAHCPDLTYGWKTTVDESTVLGQRQAHFIRHDQTRSFTEERTPDTLTVFTFGPGQPCFINPPTGAGHRVPLHRPARYLVTGGDWRGNPRGTPRRVHASAEDWVDDFANHQETIAAAIRKG
jgi:hypothetical protein